MLREMIEGLNEFEVLATMIDEYEDGIPDDLQVSINNYVKKMSKEADKFVDLIKKLQSFISDDKEKIKRLQSRINSNEHYITILRDTALKLINEGVPFSGDIHKVKKIDREKWDWDNANISAIPAKYWKSVPSIMKKEVTKAIEEGKLKGAIVPKKIESQLYIR